MFYHLISKCIIFNTFSLLIYTLVNIFLAKHLSKILIIRKNCILTSMVFFWCFVLMFIIYSWERETEHKWERGRERGKHRIPSRLQAPVSELSAQSLMAGLDLVNHKTWPEWKSDVQLTEPPRHHFWFLQESVCMHTCVSKWGGAEGKGERILSRLHVQGGALPAVGSHHPWDHNLTWNQ